MENTQQLLLMKPQLQDVTEALTQLSPFSSDEALMVLVGEKCQLELAPVVEVLNKQEVAFFGGLFPGLIYGTENYEDAIIILRLPMLEAPFVLQAAKGFEMPTLEVPVVEHRQAMICLVDGLMTGINRYLEEINNRLGDRFSFIGAGAGSLTLEQKPCLFTREGIFQDAAVCFLVNRRVRLGIRHGWERLAGPFVVTDAEANTIKALNWENAFEVYRDAIKKDSKQDIDQENFFAIASSYPFGMIREEAEDVVRDPIIVNEEGHIICVGEVPANSVVYILKGEPQKLIEAAQQAYQEASPEETFSECPLLVVDCISRILYLKEEFKIELEQLSSAERDPVGVLSLGEIASFSMGALEFFNKTIVLGQLRV